MSIKLTTSPYPFEHPNEVALQPTDDFKKVNQGDINRVRIEPSSSLSETPENGLLFSRELLALIFSFLGPKDLLINRVVSVATESLAEWSLSQITKTIFPSLAENGAQITADVAMRHFNELFAKFENEFNENLNAELKEAHQYLLKDFLDLRSCLVVWQKLSESIQSLDSPNLLELNSIAEVKSKAKEFSTWFEKNSQLMEGLSALDLNDCHLTLLPPEIGSLINLKGLGLANNQLKELPPEIGKLVNLQGLGLESNQLRNLPPEVGELVNLMALGLAGNQLKELPLEIRNLVDLLILDLNNNPIKKSPSELGLIEEIDKVFIGDRLKEKSQSIKGS